MLVLWLRLLCVVWASAGQHAGYAPSPREESRVGGGALLRSSTSWLHRGLCLVVSARRATTTSRPPPCVAPVVVAHLDESGPVLGRLWIRAMPFKLPYLLSSFRKTVQPACCLVETCVACTRICKRAIFEKGEGDLNGSLSLILLACCIDQSLYPSYPCWFWCRAYWRRCWAVQCTLYQQWLDLSEHYSGLSHTRHYTLSWVCSGCQPTT